MTMTHPRTALSHPRGCNIGQHYYHGTLTDNQQHPCYFELNVKGIFKILFKIYSSFFFQNIFKSNYVSKLHLNKYCLWYDKDNNLTPNISFIFWQLVIMLILYGEYS